MGIFITIEGVEGSGKTTLAGMLRGYFVEDGREVVGVREPGGTELGERVRSILLSHTGRIDPWAELLLYEACRAQVVEEVIRPSLERGMVVICDRFTDSTLAYQGYGRGLDLEAVESINRWVSKGIMPDITFLLDCPPEVGLERALGRINSTAGPREDRFEREDMDFHRRVREGYLKIARMEPERVRIIDATGDVESIYRKVRDVLQRYLRT